MEKITVIALDVSNVLIKKKKKINKQKSFMELPPPPFPPVEEINSIFKILLKSESEIEISQLLFGKQSKISKAKDVWREMEKTPNIFWYLTGETTESLEQIVTQISPYVKSSRKPSKFNQTRKTKLSIRNRVLMAFIWLRRYPTLNELSNMFGVDAKLVYLDIWHILSILKVQLKNYVQWPSEEEFEEIRGSFYFPNVVGSVDGTIHRVWKPLRGQGKYYRGDKKTHFISTQVIVDLNGFIINTETG